MKTKTCQHCNGTGFEPNQAAIGDTMRKMRLSKGIPLKAAAVNMGISASYLSDMELGKRAWSSDRIQQMKEAVK